MKIFVNTHSSKIEGPVDYLTHYLIRKGHQIRYISHPLDNYKDRYTELREGETSLKKINRRNLGLLNLFYDFYLSLKYLLSGYVDIFIGANNFDVIPAIFARKILRKKIEKIIYFASDFSEDRFGNFILDSIYYKFEKIALKNSDLVVSNTKRAEEKRIGFGLDKDRSVVIPNGVHLDNEIFEEKEIDKGSFIYVGNVTREHGLYDLLETLHPIIKKFVLIGSGEDWDRVIDLCKEKKIDVESFYKKDHEFTINFLQKFNGVGLAPYNMESKWTYYSSPLKVSEYISCGVPVLMSDVPEIADLVEKENYGITYNKLDLSEIEKKLQDFDLRDYYKKAKKFYGSFKHEVLFERLDL